MNKRKNFSHFSPARPPVRQALDAGHEFRHEKLAGGGVDEFRAETRVPIFEQGVDVVDGAIDQLRHAHHTAHHGVPLFVKRKLNLHDGFVFQGEILPGAVVVVLDGGREHGERVEVLQAQHGQPAKAELHGVLWTPLIRFKNKIKPIKIKFKQNKKTKIK